jgi:outer membrane immunogenic protein
MGTATPPAVFALRVCSVQEFVMKSSLFAGLLVTAATATSPAFAQEQEGPNFTGIRYEARVGHDSFDARVTMPDPAHANTTITGSSSKGRIGYGAELGYDQQLGPVVVGAYLGVDNSGTEDCIEIVGGDIGCIGTGRNLYAGGRAGVVIHRNILLYGRAGLSRSSYSLAYGGDDAGPIEYVIHDTAGGTHFGGGVEMSFTRNFYGRVEYVRTRYQRLDTVSPLDDDDAIAIRTRRNQVTAGLGFRF